MNIGLSSASYSKTSTWGFLKISLWEFYDSILKAVADKVYFKKSRVVDKPKTFSRAKTQRRQENQFLF